MMSAGPPQNLTIDETLRNMSNDIQNLFRA